MLMRKSGKVFLHILHCFIDSFNTQFPTGRIKPVCSKIGINFSGEMGPYFFEVQRNSASAPCKVFCGK